MEETRGKLKMYASNTSKKLKNGIFLFRFFVVKSLKRVEYRKESYTGRGCYLARMRELVHEENCVRGDLLAKSR